MPRRLKQTLNFPTAEPSTQTQETSADIPQPDNVERLKQNASRKRQTAEAVREIPEIFEPEQIAQLLDVYALVLAFVFSVVLKAPFDIIHESIKMDEDFKKSVSKPLAKLLSKLAPVEWAGMKDEIQVFLSLAVYSTASFGHAKSAVTKYREEMSKRRPSYRVTQTPEEKFAATPPKVVNVEPVEVPV